MKGQPLGLELDAGHLHVRSYGEEGAPLVVGVPGLTSTSIALGVIGDALAGAGRRFVAIDPRGRGASPPGDGGLTAHGRDVLGVAKALGAGTPVDVVGHSMGAFTAMRLAAKHPDAVGRLAMLDAAGMPDEDALVPIAGARERLGQVYESADAFIDEVRASGVVDPWTPEWDTIYRESLVEDGGVRAAADPDAVGADAASILDLDFKALWAKLRGPALLVRALRPLGANGGGILNADDAAEFARTVPGSELVEVDAGHYTVVTHPDTAAAVARFLAA